MIAQCSVPRCLALGVEEVQEGLLLGFVVVVVDGTPVVPLVHDEGDGDGWWSILVLVE